MNGAVRYIASRSSSGFTPTLRAAPACAVSCGRVCMEASTTQVISSRCFMVRSPVANTSPKMNFCSMAIISGSVPLPVSASPPNSVR